MLAAFNARAGTGTTKRLALFFALSLLIGSAFFMKSDAEHPISWLWLGVSALLVAIPTIGILRGKYRNSQPPDDGLFYVPGTLHLDADGVRIETANHTATFGWTLVREITETPDHLFLWYDRQQAQVVPLRGIPPELSKIDAITRIKIWANGAVASAPAELQNPNPAHDAPQRSTDRSTDRPVEMSNSRTTDGGIALLVILNAMVWLVMHRLEFGIDAEFSPWQLPNIAWYAIGFLSVAFMVGRTTRPAIGMRESMIVLLPMTAVVIGLGYATHNYLPNLFVSAMTFLSAGSILYLLLRLKTLTGNHQSSAVVVGFIVTGVFVMASSRMYVSPALWYEPDPEVGAYEQSWQENEALLFGQSGRIDTAIAEMAPRYGDASTFFLGFAGYGEEMVFAEEVNFAANVIGARFGTTDRSLLLVNDARSTDAHPLASLSGLRHALRGIANKMDLNRDVLIMSLSSHGSKYGELSVSNRSLPMRPLAATDLRAALDDAGIEWRVIIVSACYAGTFIEPLATPKTVIIAATEESRRSFGCSNDRYLTYFGEAFYRDSLPHTTSLVDAFEEARKLVTERENKEGITPSLPTARFGLEIEAKLAEIDRYSLKDS